MRIRVKYYTILVAVFFIIFMTACGEISDTVFNQEEGGKTIVSSNEKSSIIVPDSWIDEYVYNDQAEINVGLPRKEQYTIVLSESAETFTDDMTLNDYYDLIIEGLKISITNANFTEAVETKIDNLPAMTFEVHGEVDKMKISYLIALIEGKSNYYQIITWTSQNRFDDSKELYMDIINSFKANEAVDTSSKGNSDPNSSNVGYIEVLSSDGKVKLTTPNNWIEPQEPLNLDSNLNIMSESEDMYMFVIPDNKDYFTDDMTLEDYHSMVADNLTGALTNPTATEPVNTDIKDYNTLQFEIHGEVSKIKVAYLITLVETDDSYYQIIGWTAEAFFSQCKEELKEIANSFSIVE